MKNLNKTLGALFLALSLIACGGWEEEQAGEAPNVPDYHLTCEMVECANADKTEVFLSGPGDQNRSFVCTWNCVDYGDRDDVFLELEFYSVNGGCFEKDYVYINEGYCGDGG